MNEEHKSGNKAVGAFIQDNDGNFLLIQRPDDCSYCPKQWEVPGGKMDPGETPEQAVVREVKEETGLTVKPKNVICEVEFEAKGKKLIMQYWIAEMVGGDIRLSQEHQACQWLSISDFGTKELTPALDGMWKQLTPPRHKQLVLDYKKERPNFVVYAEALERTLKKACKYSLPEALVQSRAKEVPSFAEKIVRKWDKYNDPIHQMTDLCGARIIVQTIEQVKAVGEFIEANFFICEKENKEVLLGKDKFGYRDLHYIIQLKKDRAGFLGIEEAKLQTIGDRKAEIQVRTWVQHAWADTLHDRMYKNKLKLSTEVVRTGNLLAALMEEGDRDFNRLANDLDGLIVNYTAYTTRQEVEKEIEIQQMILDNELDKSKKSNLALKLARLVAASGDYARIEGLLKPYAEMEDGCRYELKHEYGYALCKVHRESPGSKKYEEGLALLEKSLRICESSDITCVPHLRKKKSLHARILARLGWAYGTYEGKLDIAREYYRKAHEIEPSNPYYLAEMLGFEMYCDHIIELPATMRTTLHQAVKTCREHAASDIELPFSYFTAGRLNILLDQPVDALGWYSRGIQYALSGNYCIPQELFEIEIDWINRLHRGHQAPPDHQQATELLTLAQDVFNKTPIKSPRSSLTAPILIVSGGAATMDKSKRLQDVNKYLFESMGGFKGTVISGGTMSGIPRCVGTAAEELKRRGTKQFHLISYIPKLLANDAPLDKRYDNHVTVGEKFSPEQILGCWKDILGSGINPEDVLLLGFGGGPISGLEYRLALGFGATVGLVAGMGGGRR